MTAKKVVFRILKILLAIVLVLVLVVVGYAAYVLIDYHRIGDAELEVVSVNDEQVAVGGEYTLLSWNIGFGAYSEDYSFFMDGGKYSRAYSRQEVEKNVNGAIEIIGGVNADFIFVQEVDVKATRSYKVDERAMLTAAFDEYDGTFAVNYDSPYLFYPILEPHGKSLAGMLTLSKYQMLSSQRVSLPVEKGFMKLLDLDRCYDKIEIAAAGGKKLFLYNLHLSAYTSDGSIATKQLELLMADMLAEYQNGNYAICGGDFNKDLLGDSSAIFGVSGENASWALPFPEEMLGENFTLAAGYNAENPVPSCRNCDTGYIAGETFVLTVDGFIASANVEIMSSAVIDAGFEFSDHNPVQMTFKLL